VFLSIDELSLKMEWKTKGVEARQSSNGINNQKKKLKILKRKGELPIELRNLIDNYEDGNVWSCLKPTTTNNSDHDNDNEAGDFLRVVEDQLFDLLTEGRRCDVSCDVSCDDRSCRGNDGNNNKNKNTKNGSNGCLWDPSEVETAIRFFPSVLSREPYPIVCLLRLVHYNMIHLSSSSRSCEKSGYCTGCIALVPLLAELGSELSEISDSGCTFEPHQRGGLLLHREKPSNSIPQTTQQQKLACEDSVLQKLCKIGDCQHPSIEEACCSVLRELTFKGLLVEKDVRELGLLKEICWNIDFPEHIFRFLALNLSSSFLKLMSLNPFLGARNAFKGVLEVGMDLFPVEIGCLFRKNFTEGKTTYETTCAMFGKAYTNKIVYKVLETYLCKNQQQTTAVVSSATATATATATTTTNCDAVANEKTRNAMIVFAATNNSVPLDFVYFLFRRDSQFFLPTTSIGTPWPVGRHWNRSTRILPRECKRRNRKKFQEAAVLRERTNKRRDG